MNDQRIEELDTLIAYRDTERLVYHTVHEFRKTYGGDFDELASEAHELFLDALRTYKKELGDFPARVRYIIWNGLKDSQIYKKKRKKRGGHFSRVDIDWDFLQQKESREDRLARLRAELSDDGKTLIDLSIMQDDSKKPETIRRKLTEHLIESGWSLLRVAEAFSEIAEALT